MSYEMTKYVHIDMKGGPPTLAYLLELLEVMSQWGAEGVVMEWEDMFPWSGDLAVLARPGHYTLEMVSCWPAGRDGEAGDGGPPRPLLSPHRV